MQANNDLGYGSDMKVVLHLGAHKTASTYLQARLGNSTNVLTGRQITYIGPEAVRETLSRAGSLQFAGKPIAFRTRRRLTRAMGKLVHDAACMGASRVIISEETLLGRLSEIHDNGRFFEEVHRRLRVFRNTFDDVDLEILLAVRGLDGFLPSVWSHMALRRGYTPFDMERARRMIDARRRWSNVVEDVAKTYPNARLTVWRYEDMKAVETHVLRAFADDYGVSAIEPIKWRALSGLSALAVEALEKLRADGTPCGPEQVRKLWRKFPKPKGHADFQPFDNDMLDRLRADYAQDLERITAMDRVTVLAPDDQFGKNVRKNAEASQPAASATRIDTIP